MQVFGKLPTRREWFLYQLFFWGVMATCIARGVAATLAMSGTIKDSWLLVGTQSALASLLASIIVLISMSAIFAYFSRERRRMMARVGH